MIFKSTTVAVLVSSLLSPAAVATNSGDISMLSVAKPTSNAFAEQSERGIYSIVLNAEAAGLQHNTPATKAKLALITQMQSDILALARLNDTSASMDFRTRLLSNTMSMRMNQEAVNALKNNTNVASVSLIASLDSEPLKLMAGKDDEQGVSGGDSLHQTYPFLKVNPAGDNVTVALIGPGVDYTHTALGGAVDNQGYFNAWMNNTNAWDEFPNDVVIGGFDFASENSGYDYNPLEYHSKLVDRNFDTLEFHAGYGTASAFAVLNAVPNAKIYAYKTEGVTFEGNVIVDGLASAKFVAALEMAIDPNLDGDISDRADIILLSRSLGGLGFIDENDNSHSHGSVTVQLVRDIAATGALVIAGAGNWGSYDTYFNIANRALAPEVLTVGFSEREENQYSIAYDSPIGPTRGPDSVLKPDVVAVTSEMTAPIVSSNTGFDKLEDNVSLAMARATSAAASIMDEHPQLTAAEVKALLVNTGITAINNSHGVAQIGGGSVNPIAATTSHALMYQKGNYQPSLNFDQVKVFGQNTFSKEVIIKNLSNETQHYNVVINKNGNKVNNDAVQLSFPNQITLAPNSEITVPVTVSIDANDLAKNPFVTTQDFSAAQWDEYAVNGNITLVHDVSPGASIHIPWLIMPRRGDTFVVDGNYERGDWINIPDNSVDFIPPHDADWREKVPYSIAQDYNVVEVENVSNVEQTLYALPLIYHVDEYPNDKKARVGNIIKTIAGDLTQADAAQCPSGKQLTLAVTFFDPLQIPTSKHFDRFAGTMLAINLYDKETVELAEYKARTLDGFQLSPGHITRLSLRLDDVRKVGMQYIDLSMPYDPMDPLKRHKWADGETIAVPGNDTIVSNVCIDTLFHGQINEQTFNDVIGMQFSTDRDNVPGYYDDVLTHNFDLGGHSVEGEPDEEAPEIVECETGFVKDNNDNCIQLYDEHTLGVDLVDYIATATGTEKEEFTFDCGSWDDNLNAQCTAIHSKTYMMQFLSPNRNPEGLTCDFAKESTTAICYPRNLVRDNGDVEDLMNFRVTMMVDQILKPAFVATDNSFLTGIAIKMANSKEQPENKVWDNKITLQAGERAVISYLRDTACGGGVTNPAGVVDPLTCSEGGYVFDPVSDFKRIATNNSSYSTVAPGQEFTVSEDAQIGDILGQVRITNRLLKETFDQEEDLYFNMMLMDAGFGAPFHLSKQGILSVRDNALLDFENNPSYQLKIALRLGNSMGAVNTIKVNLRNANDNAPEQFNEINDIVAVQNQPIESINLSQYFSDIDGIGMVFTASDLPAGLVVDKAGILSGTPSQSGEFNATITVSDGVHSLTSDIQFTIERDSSSASDADDAANDSSGGSAAMLLFAFVALSRRLVMKNILARL
ncbi:S8 family serine peptidase [Thalassotalea fonticola]|uniref:S8 family serine peptidase n=1 Tax=Thalassotalea fonticola TaxID=3065649 RepID=A0ABZ0GRQ6_9GAMM|nr:S8 family serine peptidase [Colwelliaceae bacterium S1-1]